MSKYPKPSDQEIARLHKNLPIVSQESQWEKDPFLKEAFFRRSLYFSEKYHLIFILLPKTGSISVTHFIQNLDPDSYLFPELDVLTDNDYLRVMFVRNPFDRNVSTFRSNPSRFGHNFERCMFRQAWNKKGEETNHHFIEQVRYLEFLPTFIGRFENYENDFNEICKLTGIKGSYSQMHNLNKKNIKNKHYSEYYNRRTRKFVTKKSLRDLEKFEYKFETP